jgi:CubicO group peptidase (beta-lactamase class C family)
MPVIDELNKVNPKGPFGSTVTNFAAVSKAGAAASDAAGQQDFTKPESAQADGSTMFGEGSIGKVRFAGLAYMLQQEGIIDLQQNAGEFFSAEGVGGKFLAKKYPGQGRVPQTEGEALQAEIGKLFSGDNAAATLADLTTHRAGIGDLTRDQARLTAEKGVGHQFSVPELLLIPERHRGIPRDGDGKPRAQSSPETLDAALPAAKYGAHQYSNLGYMILGLAMEAAYDDKKNPEGKDPKDYKQLTRDYMLDPKEGPAAGKGLAFSQTKFPEDLSASDNVARSSWFERGGMVDATKFSAANAAGGMFASADDSAKFFSEYFKGFPGTPEHGEEGANKFFSAETIELMMAEGRKFGREGVNNSKDEKRKGNERFQAPGFVFEEDKTSGKAAYYEKGGGTFGYASQLNFSPTAGVKIDMCAQENVTSEVAKRLGTELSDVIGRYSGESGEFNRADMIKKEMPELERPKLVGDLLEAIRDSALALKKSGATAAVDGASGPGNVPAASSRSSGGEGRQ